MNNHELARARAEVQAIGADWALLTSPENVTYVSHYEVPVESGPLAQLNYGPVMALFGVEEPTTYLLANRYYAGAARQQSPFDEVIGFGILEVFAPFVPQVARENFVAALRQLLQQTQLGSGKTKLAVEERTLPLIAPGCPWLPIVYCKIGFPNVELVDAGAALARARMVNTEREIGLLKSTAEVVNIAHKKVIELTQQAHKSEFEIWAELTKAMHQHVGGKLFVAGEVVCGPRNKTVSPVGPIHYAAQPGDVAEPDICPRYHGYWADMANTMIVSAKPTPVQKKGCASGA